MSLDRRAAASVACLVAGMASTVHAEGDRALSLGFGWATFSALGKQVGNMAPPTIAPDAGASLGVMYEHSIGSDVSLRGEAAGQVFYGGGTAKQGDTSYAGLGDVGIVFRFDVLKYVPYAFGGVGAVVSDGGPLDRGAELVLAVGGGLDILESRSRSWGFEGRLASFGGDVTIFTLGVRGSVRWGYF